MFKRGNVEPGTAPVLAVVAAMFCLLSALVCVGVELVGRIWPGTP